MKMKHVPEASDIPSFADAVGSGGGGVQHHLDVVAQASGFSEKEAHDLDAFVESEGWGGGDEADADEGDGEEGQGADGSDDGGRGQDEEDANESEESEGSEGEGDEESKGDGGRIRRVKAPESVTKRAHAAVQRTRKAAGAGGAAKPSRNQQKRREKGRMLYKHKDF